MSATQRLIVCLDGTWNRQDSSTNVLHHFNLMPEGMIPEGGVIQRKFYDPGVGTGVLDSVTGGAFGIGLEANVRDAYNWLIANYHDEGPSPPDEIFVFGFSRGAFTARSLVGFIAQCGLLRRGGPITVEQLWRDYCVLGRRKEKRESIWERILGTRNSQIKAYTDLERAVERTPDQDLLLRWSRRVNIQYLGLYDTVGAIGIDALAIPGLTSRLALHNNVRPTTLIQNCRHALAIDEHRSNFNYTPFLAYLEEGSEELERADGSGSRSIAQQRAMWNRKIEQRWFVGAHSNVGGGYDNNRLAQRPLEWLMEGAAKAGLRCETVPPVSPVNARDVTPRDSYAEFAFHLWDTVIRNKRNFRCISPQATLRARRGSGHGFALETIHETVDDSVLAFWANSDQPVPPNLECYWKGRLGGLPRGVTEARHLWFRDSWFAFAALVVWTLVAIYGAYAVDTLGGFTARGLPLWFGAAAAIFLPLIDWGESKVTFGYAVGKGGPRARAFLDTVYWTRSTGFVLFLFGVFYGSTVLLAAGLRHQWPISLEWLSRYGWLGPLAALPALLLTKGRSRFAWLAMVLGPLCLFVFGGVLFVIGAFVKGLFPGVDVAEFWGHVGPVSLPGCLVLLQLGTLSFWRSLLWVGEPLSDANLDSITKLQLCATPGGVIRCLDQWRDRLANTAKPDPSPDGAPAENLRQILRLALWRDILGFIPLYTLFLLFGLKLATLVPYPAWTASLIAPLVPSWWVLPLVAAGADFLEDFCHLRYCRWYEQDSSQARPSALLTAFSFTMTIVKDVAFSVSLGVTLAAILVGTYAVLPLVLDWRAKIAITLTLAGLVALALLLMAWAVGAIRKRGSVEERSTPTQIKSATA